MKLRFVLGITLFLFLVLFTRLLISPVFSQTPTPPDDPNKKYGELQNEIEELTRKLEETRSKKVTLANQIAFMDNQISLTTLRIQETTVKIGEMEKEIEKLKERIGILEQSLTTVSELLIDRIQANYKSGVVLPYYALLQSDGFSELISRSKYLRLVQAHDTKLLFEVQATKADFEQQKQLFEQKKAELDHLQAQLEQQKVSLNQQKVDKEALLTVTRSDEKRYQDLLLQARSEQAAIEKAMRQAIVQLKDGTPIEEGKEIGLMGNSGAPSCSTGPHLHMEITKDGVRNNPSDYLKSIGVNWDNSPDGPFSFNGSWNWPMSEPIRITQGYGMTYWARTGFYGGGPHNGLDMVSSNIVIHAPKSGTLYKGTFGCGSSTLKWVAVDHGGGIITWYFHVQ